MSLIYSLEGFIAGDCTKALIELLIPSIHLRGTGYHPGKPWSPHINHVQVWVEEYNGRCQQLGDLCGLVSWHHLRMTDEEQTSEYLAEFGHFDQARIQFDAHRHQCGLITQEGYAAGFEGKPPREDFTPCDEGFSYFLGYQQGLRRRGQRGTPIKVKSRRGMRLVKQ